ncbi:nodulation protein NolB [Bradyrhizobium brasilense]|uniref:nodulation protein NolB n=1 Tax=Bradyrhizobium brasilense TaxID=1419277 RepID=UPI0015A4765F|nr:nodulation protein NolB [Bradyrhizobium brasilense]
MIVLRRQLRSKVELRWWHTAWHPAGKPEGRDHFDSALTNLWDVDDRVIQVSLISKGAGAVSLSLNKLLSVG